MSFKAPVGSSVKRELIPEDSFQSVCYALFDLGTHDSDYQGNVTEKREVVLIFEIPSLRIEYEKDGEKLEGPKVISKRYTWSMHEKANLRKDMETWRGKSFTDLEAADFDFEQLLGANCIIQVMHKEKSNGDKYAKIGSITKTLKGMEKLNPENPKGFFTFIAPYVENGEMNFADSMPEWVQNIIKESKEYKWIQDGNDSSPYDKIEDEFAENETEKAQAETEANEPDDLPF